MVDVDGRSLHLTCVGSGAPTVVMENGLDGDGVHVELTSCRRSRRTRGSAPTAGPTSHRSDPREGKHTAADSVADLRQALKAAGEADPYVLVGFSVRWPDHAVYAAKLRTRSPAWYWSSPTIPMNGPGREAPRVQSRYAVVPQLANTNSEGVDVFAGFDQAERAGRDPRRSIGCRDGDQVGPVWLVPRWIRRCSTDCGHSSRRSRDPLIGAVLEVMAARSGHDSRPSTEVGLLRRSRGASALFRRICRFDSVAPCGMDNQGL